MFLLAVLLLAACTPPQNAGTPVSVSPTFTRQPSATSTIAPTASLTASPTAVPPTLTKTPRMPTAAPCDESQGHILKVEIPTERLNLPIQTRVYLPPCYRAEGAPGYPVLTMLHGQGYENDQWVKLGLTDEADRLITAGQIDPLIIVMPYELSWAAGPEGSKYGEAVVEDVLPYIEEHYNACAERACRAVGGLSRGGNWAVNLGFTYPEEFAAVGAHSAPLFFGEMTRISGALSHISSVMELPAFFIDVGNKDTNRNDVLDFVTVLDKAGVDYQFYQFLGLHDETYWSSHVHEYLLWYASQFAKGD
jgi:enterochelin esterase-like enzyme